MKTTIIYFGFLFIFSSCNSPTGKKEINSKDSLLIEKDTLSKGLTAKDSVFIKNLKPIFGYRFTITGDFDGDGKQEILTEHFYSLINNKETNKFYQGISYEHLVNITVMKKPFSFVIADNTKIDTLRISKAEQLLGLSFLKNEGDLNGDGNDEVSYIINAADWSACNTCHIVSYKKGKWNEIFSFAIRDWQLPALPEVQSNYGLLGVEKMTFTENDTLNGRIEKELETFSGFIRKKKSGKIEVQTFNEEVEDTIVVLTKKDLRVKS